MNTTDLLGIKINITSYQDSIDQIIVWTQEKKSRCVNICNVHSLTSSLWTKKLRTSLKTGDMNTPDGMPLVWMQKWLGTPTAQRTYGPTLMMESMAAFEKSGTSVAFYGGHQDRLNTLIRKIRVKFPKLKIVEAISPPFRPLTTEEHNTYIQRLKSAQPDVLWVGIGCPKQEIWMNENRHNLNCVMIGVGAAFDFHAGAVSQAPSILQNNGLEWAYRLYTEPKRLWKRYLTTNPIFIVYAFARLFIYFTKKSLPTKFTF